MKTRTIIPSTWFSRFGRIYAALLLAAWAGGVSAQTASSAGTNDAEAAQAWRETYRATQSPMPPPEWQENEPTPEEKTAYYVPRLIKGADQAKDFYTRFPDQAKAEAARKAEYRLLSIAVREFGEKSLSDRLAMVILARLKDPKLTEEERTALIKDPNTPGDQRVVLLRDSKLPDDDKFTLRAEALAQLAQKLPDGMSNFLAQVEKLRADYPKRLEVYGLLMTAMQKGTPDQAKAIAKEIADSDAPDEVKTKAAGLQRPSDRVGKPLDIQFTAFDGREVDLSKMKGKVVLVDFWATWCRPCVGELPNVKAAYEKLHDRGFEIVSISLDSEKDALTKFLAKEQMPWPQYFDGLEWKNKFAVKFGIQAIPTMWLVDKQGNLRDVEPRDGLEEHVEALLKE
jgi:peroxiredoxin